MKGKSYRKPAQCPSSYFAADLFHPLHGIEFERQVIVNKNLVLCFHTISHILQDFRIIMLDEGGLNVFSLTF
jgi:hypothetical protein